jgi:hypothetical protein
MKLCPFTKEEMDSLKGYEKVKALKLYYAWLAAQRKNDRLDIRRLKSRIYRFINKEKVDNGIKKWKKKNPNKVKEYRQNHYWKHRRHQYCLICMKCLRDVSNTCFCCDDHKKLYQLRVSRERERYRRIFERFVK